MAYSHYGIAVKSRAWPLHLKLTLKLIGQAVLNNPLYLSDLSIILAKFFTLNEMIVF